MQKRNLLLVFTVTILSISFVSAAYYGGGFSITDFFAELNPSDLLLGATFIISFAVLNFALLKFFKGNRGTAGVIALAVALLISYGVYTTGFDLEGLFYGIGISADILLPITSFILLAGIIFLMWKFGFGMTLMILGLLLVGLAFTDFIYEKGIAFIIGFILLVVGFLMWRKRKKKTD